MLRARIATSRHGKHARLQPLGIVPPDTLVESIALLGPFLHRLEISTGMLNLEDWLEPAVRAELGGNFRDGRHVGFAHQTLADGVDAVFCFRGSELAHTNTPIVSHVKGGRISRTDVRFET